MKTWSLAFAAAAASGSAAAAAAVAASGSAAAATAAAAAAAAVAADRAAFCSRHPHSTGFKCMINHKPSCLSSSMEKCP